MNRLEALYKERSLVDQEIRSLEGPGEQAEITQGRTAAPSKRWQVDGGIPASSDISPEFLLQEIFKYHSPSPEQQIHYETIRDAAKAFGLVLWKHTPAGADRTAAIRKLREAVMTANAGIALQGLSL